MLENKGKSFDNVPIFSLRSWSQIMVSQQTFQRCSNVIHWLIWYRVVGKRQINFETTLCMSTLELTTLNNVESTLPISTFQQTLRNLKTAFTFSTLIYTTLSNVKTMLWIWPLKNREIELWIKNIILLSFK